MVKDSNGVFPKLGGARLQTTMQMPTWALGPDPQHMRAFLIHVPTTGQWPMILLGKRERNDTVGREKEKLSGSHILEALDSSLLERREVTRGGTKGTKR